MNIDTNQLIQEDYNKQTKTKLQIKADLLKEIQKRKENVQKELENIKFQVKDLNLKYKESQRKTSDQFNDPTNTNSDNNQKQSPFSRKNQEIFKFIEKFSLTLQTGTDTFKINFYSIDDQQNEKEQCSFQIKVIDYLLELVDQRDHIHVLKNEHFEVKLVLRWIYDQDIEKLSELQTQQYKIEKELFLIEDHYTKAVKNIQQMSQKQPQITQVKEEWGVFLVSPKGISNFHNQLAQQSHLNQSNMLRNSLTMNNAQKCSNLIKDEEIKINNSSLNHSQTLNASQQHHNHGSGMHHDHHLVKTVHIDLIDNQYKTESPASNKILAPTHDNLKQLEKPKKRANMSGSIMDAIFHDLSGQKPGIAKSMALSNTSAFSTMRAGQFFKMVDSPFKTSMLNAYEKIQTKVAQSQMNGGNTAQQTPKNHINFRGLRQQHSFGASDTFLRTSTLYQTQNSGQQQQATNPLVSATGKHLKVDLSDLQ
eukprot:403376721